MQGPLSQWKYLAELLVVKHSVHTSYSLFLILLGLRRDID